MPPSVQYSYGEASGGPSVLDEEAAIVEVAAGPPHTHDSEPDAFGVVFQSLFAVLPRDMVFEATVIDNT